MVLTQKLFNQVICVFVPLGFEKSSWKRFFNKNRKIKYRRTYHPNMVIGKYCKSEDIEKRKLPISN